MGGLHWDLYGSLSLAACFRPISYLLFQAPIRGTCLKYQNGYSIVALLKPHSTLCNGPLPATLKPYSACSTTARGHFRPPDSAQQTTIEGIRASAYANYNLAMKHRHV